MQAMIIYMDVMTIKMFFKDQRVVCVLPVLNKNIFLPPQLRSVEDLVTEFRTKSYAFGLV